VGFVEGDFGEGDVVVVVGRLGFAMLGVLPLPWTGGIFDGCWDDGRTVGIGRLLDWCNEKWERDVVDLQGRPATCPSAFLRKHTYTP
jgi:hypothetical protein